MVWILLLPYGATGGSRVGYLVAFMVFMLLLDAAFTYALYRSAGRRHDRAVDFWLLFVFLIGALSYLRFDLLPAVLAGGALLAARRRPWVTGALTGLGAAIKLWPALLIPSFLSYRPDRKPAGLAFVVVGFGLAAVSLLAGGWSRLFSPLTWQSDRGLQIESIWATPLMVGPGRPARRLDRSTSPATRPTRSSARASSSGSWSATWPPWSGSSSWRVLFVRAFRAGGSHPGRGRLPGRGHRGDDDRDQQDAQSAVPALAGRPAAALLLLRRQASAGRAPGHPAGPRTQLLLLALLDPPGLPAALRRPARPRRARDDRRRHRGHRAAQHRPARCSPATSAGWPGASWALDSAAGRCMIENRSAPGPLTC